MEGLSVNAFLQRSRAVFIFSDADIKKYLIEVYKRSGNRSLLKILQSEGMRREKASKTASIQLHT